MARSYERTPKQEARSNAIMIVILFFLLLVIGVLFVGVALVYRLIR